MPDEHPRPSKPFSRGELARFYDQAFSAMAMPHDLNAPDYVMEEIEKMVREHDEQAEAIMVFTACNLANMTERLEAKYPSCGACGRWLFSGIEHQCDGPNPEVSDAE